jgi:hypothetical protein
MTKYIETKTPKQRNVVLNKLFKSGYKCSGFTFEMLNEYYPHNCGWTKIILDSPIKGQFDLYCGDLNWSTECIEVPASSLKAAKVVDEMPVLPFTAPKKYQIVYLTRENKRKTYVVSNPIEETEDKVTCYAFGVGKGVRSFFKSCILSAYEI